MAFINPLDLGTIFINVLSGSVIIFIFIAFIVLALLAAKFRMSNQIFLMLLFLFLIMFAFSLGQTGLYLLAVLLAGLAVYWALQRVMKTFR